MLTVPDNMQRVVGGIRYRAALADARQEVRREWQIEQRAAPPAQTWAMSADDQDSSGDDFQWLK